MLSAATLVVVAFASGAAPSAAAESTSKLDPVDLATIQRAEEAGRSRVTLLVAARNQRSDEVADSIRRLGGSITGGEERIGYVKASVPTALAVKVSQVPGILAVDVDRLIPIDDPVVTGQAATQPQAPPGAATPRANPYMPVQDFGADEFTEDPARDGRNVTVAVLDTGVDLNHPALSTSTDSAPKVVDWFNAIPPNAGDGTWVSTEGRLNGNFTRLGQSWNAPAAGGPFAFGTLVEDRLDLGTGEVGGDLNRNGIIGETFGVLQDRGTKEVLVDTDRDRDFTDEEALLDYRVDGDVGVLGTDNPATPVKEEMTFAVGTHRSNYDPASDAGSWVDIGIAGGSHGTHVAGIVAANEMFGGAMGGAAPGAQVMSIQVCLVEAGCVNSAMLDGMTYAAENGADVANLSVGGLPALNDGNNARGILYNNLIAEYDMQIFISAGNEGSGANTVGDPAVATDAVAVGASVTKETWLSNYGATNEIDQMLMPFSSRGPSESGAMKPEIVAPGSAVSTIQPWQSGAPAPGTFALPPGYAMYNGTSMSSPQAAGAAALLVGAYKDEFGQRPPADELRNALISTAGFIDGVPAHGQGTGLIDVEAAWQQLSTVAPVPASKITATVPVNTVLSGFLAQPGVGRGIHDREDVESGDEIVRTYTLTRTTGDPGPVDFDVTWKGNDGTFSSATTVALPLNVPTSFPVAVAPEDPGIHSATLQLDDPATNGVDLSTQNVVFATEAGAGNRTQMSGEVGRADSESLLIDVPAGASALRVELDGGGPAAEDGQVRFLRQNPYGINVDEIGSSACFNPDTGAGCSVGSPTVRVIENPIPGVWEIAVEGFRNASTQDSPYTVTASVLDATVSPSRDVILAPDLEPVVRTYEVSNEAEAFTGRLAGGPLASSRSGRADIAEAEERRFTIEVPAGTERVAASIGNPSDPASDIDLYLYRCLETCVEVDAGESSGSAETVSLDDPAPARYVVAVVPYELPGGPTEYDYFDTWINPSLGEVETVDTNQLRESGGSWSVEATVAPLKKAGRGRFLTGSLQVLDNNEATIGRGSLALVVDPDSLTTTITKRPPSITQFRSPTFEFSSDVAGMSFECRVDTAAWQACVSPHTTAELTNGLNGDHRFEVRGTDPNGNVGNPASADFTIVAATTITAGEAAVAWEGTSTRITPSARLHSASTGASGWSGMTVDFLAGGERICSARTDAQGVASCSGLLGTFDPATTRKYRAVFGGERRLGPSEGSGMLTDRGGTPPDTIAPRILGRLQLKPVKLRAGQRAMLSLRVSEAGSMRLVLRNGKRRKVVSRQVSAGRSTVRLPSLGRGRWSASATVTDAAANRSAAKSLKFRVR